MLQPHLGRVHYRACLMWRIQACQKSHFRLTRHSDFSKTAGKISGKISRKKVFQTCQKQSMPFPSFRFTAHLKNFVRSIDASVTAVHQRLLMHNPNDQIQSEYAGKFSSSLHFSNWIWSSMFSDWKIYMHGLTHAVRINLKLLNLWLSAKFSTNFDSHNNREFKYPVIAPVHLAFLAISTHLATRSFIIEFVDVALN